VKRARARAPLTSDTRYLPADRQIQPIRCEILDSAENFREAAEKHLHCPDLQFLTEHGD